MIQDTSAHAWALLTQGLTFRQKEVLDRLRYFPDVTNMELAVSMGWTINRVTGRVGELVKIGLVLDAGKRRCKITNGMSHAWKAKHPVLPPAFKDKKDDGSQQAEQEYNQHLFT
jgi:hypothetical protein